MIEDFLHVSRRSAIWLIWISSEFSAPRLDRPLVCAACAVRSRLLRRTGLAQLANPKDIDATISTTTRIVRRDPEWPLVYHPNRAAVCCLRRYCLHRDSDRILLEFVAHAS